MEMFIHGAIFGAACASLMGGVMVLAVMLGGRRDPSGYVEGLERELVDQHNAIVERDQKILELEGKPVREGLR